MKSKMATGSGGGGGGVPPRHTAARDSIFWSAPLFLLPLLHIQLTP